MAILQEIRELIFPLPGAHRVACCQTTGDSQVLDVFFTFANPDNLIFRGRDDRGKIVEHQANTFDAPIMFLSWSTLAEVLGGESDRLKQDFVYFIAVLIDGNDLPKLTIGMAVRAGICWRMLDSAMAFTFEFM